MPTWTRPESVTVIPGRRALGLAGIGSAIVAGVLLAGGVPVPHWHVPWGLLAMGGVLAGCGVLSAAGLAFARWEARRAEPVPQVTRWRSGERMR